ncbi:ChaB family protein [Kocuria sp.]|jgi:cation transport regulator ChaB|uniref:ChaB family protein n=1 Tax=Kocuria sp. TaxID=1871328 RepID=UPI0026DEF394|nr:ChaB family protein [Kocuria sp.]MDO5368009.1 ChaB family protein [Kocuria sp.]
MPKANKDGRAIQDEIPSTLRRSDEKAQDTFAQTYDSAKDEYDSSSRAARTAWSAVKHTHEKVGDHWEPKDENGPSDERAEKGGLNEEKSAGGVDAKASKEHLYGIAQELDITGRSDMTKDELVDAIDKANRKKTKEARG